MSAKLSGEFTTTWDNYHKEVGVRVWGGGGGGGGARGWGDSCGALSFPPAQRQSAQLNTVLS